MNKNCNIGRTALMQTIVEMDYELRGIDIHWAYSFLAKCSDTELIKIYGLIYDKYYNEKYINYEECGNYNIGDGIEDITIVGTVET